MKRNYSYLQGGNLPQKKLPKLNDQEIEKLYKYYSSKDKFHKKFQGTKRDYCSAVAGLIENFYQKNKLAKVDFSKFKKLTGGVKDLEWVKQRVKIGTDRDTGKKYAMTKKITNVDNVYTTGDFVPRLESKHYSKTGGDLTYDELIAHANKYESYLDTLFETEISQTNFLLCAKFDDFVSFTNAGKAERKAVTKLLRHSGIDVSGKDWDTQLEASYRTEYIYFKNVLSKILPKEYTEEEIRFYCLQKLFSKEAGYAVLDFPFGTAVYELKGNLGIGESERGMTVDTKKVSEIILESLKGPIKTANVSFILYPNNDDMNKFELDATGRLVGGEKYYVEGIINFDITKMLKSDVGRKYLPFIKKYIQEYSVETRPKKATAIAKKLVVDDFVFTMVKEYFGATTLTEVGHPKLGKSTGEHTFELDISKPNISSKLDLLVYSKKLIGKDNATVDDFYRARNNTSNYDDFVMSGSNDLTTNDSKIEEIRPPSEESRPVIDIRDLEPGETIETVGSVKSVKTDAKAEVTALINSLLPEGKKIKAAGNDQMKEFLRDVAKVTFKSTDGAEVLQDKVRTYIESINPALREARIKAEAEASITAGEEGQRIAEQERKTEAEKASSKPVVVDDEEVAEKQRKELEKLAAASPIGQTREQLEKTLAAASSSSTTAAVTQTPEEIFKFIHGYVPAQKAMFTQLTGLKVRKNEDIVPSIPAYLASDKGKSDLEQKKAQTDLKK